ncbi:DUF4179 domain-containing protein [Bacillus sp. 31A1R]|uniref:DUF4179 domain-containing protein n=1 Tax=Robertmurraya mangrovi TaxID=3098077 RepID=A0ABU5IWA2_9BACI|nr:DUF4179 domain-containing protein [Bacillus sp. 31A1R]MDZ5471437.1 DUF4179 domain-containing protein [Bacillus sp. 31A1R]
MDNKLNKLKEELNNPEMRQALTFTQQDRDMVFQVIKQNNTVTHNHPRKNHINRFAIPAVAASLLMVGSVSFSPNLQETLAKVPGMDYLFELFADEGVQKAKKEELFYKLNEKVTSNGISVTINELLYDGSRLIIRYTAESDTKIVSGQNAAPGNMLLTINGEEDNYSLGSTGHHEQSSNREELLLEVSTSKSLPDQFELGISFLKIGETTGDWTFEIPVKKNEKLTHTVKTDISAKYNETDTTMTVQEVNFSPTAIAIKTQVKNPIYWHDSIQKMVSKNEITEGDPFITFEVIDDKGYVLPYIKVDNPLHSPTIMVMPYEDLSYLPETLTVKTIIQRAWGAALEGTPHKFENKKPLLSKIPYLVEQEQNAGLIVSKVEEINAEIHVHYEIKGNMHLKRNSIYLLTEQDNEKITPYNYSEMDYYKRSHIAKFKANKPLEKLFIGTMKTDYREIKELEITIPIK